MSFSLKSLQVAVSEHAAFRRRVRLQPVGGPGDKVFPPTYPGEGRNAPPRHVFEKRRVDGSDIWTVLLDSVQSSANRSEEALLSLARKGSIELPYLSVSFEGTEVPEVGEITSLDAPHRVFDAILRDSQLDGKPLMKSEVGGELLRANLAHATAIFETSPTALLFGAWNSTGEGGGLGAKFPRCFVSEIVGINVPVDDPSKPDPNSAGRRPGSRIDPLGILKGVSVYKSDKTTDWDIKQVSKDYKKSKPSEINHGNIAPSITDLGVTMEYAEHTTVVSFAALRRLGFGDTNRDLAARTMLAALGLVAHFGQIKEGYALRSRCDLVFEGATSLQLIRFDGGRDDVPVDYDAAIKLYHEAVEAARLAGFKLDKAPLLLVPQEKLVNLVKQSRELALAGKGGEEQEAAADAGT
jgi:CRISPR-associated protein Csb1